MLLPRGGLTLYWGLSWSYLSLTAFRMLSLSLNSSISTRVFRLWVCLHLPSFECTVPAQEEHRCLMTLGVFSHEVWVTSVLLSPLSLWVSHRAYAAMFNGILPSSGAHFIFSYFFLILSCLSLRALRLQNLKFVYSNLFELGWSSSFCSNYCTSQVSIFCLTLFCSFHRFAEILFDTVPSSHLPIQL